MAIEQQRTLPAQFVEDLGVDLAKQITAQTGVPIVTTGIAGISQQLQKVLKQDKMQLEHLQQDNKV